LARRLLCERTPRETVMAVTTIITVLKKDHDEVDLLFDKATSTKNTDKRRALFGKINETLQVHTQFEEEHLYPVLEAKKSTKDHALEALEEHAVIKHLLAEIAQTDPADDRWKAKVTVLAENVRHHVKEEEQKGGLFEKLKKSLTDDELAQLADEYLATKTA